MNLLCRSLFPGVKKSSLNAVFSLKTTFADFEISFQEQTGPILMFENLVRALTAPILISEIRILVQT